MSRRWFLGGSVAAGVALAAGCHRSRDGAAAANGVIAVASLPFYVDSSTNPGFTAQTGIRVVYHEDVDDEEAWFANAARRLADDNPLDRDVVVVSDWIAARLDGRGWLQPLDRRAMPNLAHVAVRVPDPEHTVPWAQGMVGIAYDSTRLRAEPTRFATLFSEPLHGLVAVPTDARIALGIALLADGIDPSTVAMSDLASTAQRLTNSVAIGQVLPLDGTPAMTRLLRGDAHAAVVRASDVVSVSVARPEIRFLVPDEGGLLLTDVAAVPVRAANPEGAMSYLDYVCDPDHAAERFRAVPVLWTVDGVEERLRRLAPAVADDPRRNPPEDARSRLRAFRLLDPDEEATLGQLFAGVRAGHQ